MSTTESKLNFKHLIYIPYQQLSILKQVLFHCISNEQREYLQEETKRILSQSTEYKDIEIESMETSEDNVSIVSLQSQRDENKENQKQYDLSSFSNVPIPEINDSTCLFLIFENNFFPVRL